MSRRKSREKCEIFAGFESRVQLRLKEFDMLSLSRIPTAIVPLSQQFSGALTPRF